MKELFKAFLKDSSRELFVFKVPNFSYFTYKHSVQQTVIARKETLHNGYKALYFDMPQADSSITAKCYIGIIASDGRLRFPDKMLLQKTLKWKPRCRDEKNLCIRLGREVEKQLTSTPRFYTPPNQRMIYELIIKHARYDNRFYFQREPFSCELQYAFLTGEGDAWAEDYAKRYLSKRRDYRIQKFRYAAHLAHVALYDGLMQNPTHPIHLCAEMMTATQGHRNIEVQYVDGAWYENEKSGQIKTAYMKRENLFSEFTLPYWIRIATKAIPTSSYKTPYTRILCIKDHHQILWQKTSSLSERENTAIQLLKDKILQAAVKQPLPAYQDPSINEEDELMADIIAEKLYFDGHDSLNEDVVLEGYAFSKSFVDYPLKDDEVITLWVERYFKKWAKQCAGWNQFTLKNCILSNLEHVRQLLSYIRRINQRMTELDEDKSHPIHRYIAMKKAVTMYAEVEAVVKFPDGKLIALDVPSKVLTYCEIDGRPEYIDTISLCNLVRNFVNRFFFRGRIPKSEVVALRHHGNVLWFDPSQ